MKVLLVRPDSRALHLDPRPGPSRFGERNQPLGLLYLGTALALAGHSVRIADEVVGDDAPEEIARSGAELIGFTVTSPLVRRTAELVRAASRCGAATVVGGPHVSALPEQSLLATGADMAVVGEGERAVTEICSGASPEAISGLALRRSGKILRTAPRSPEPDLDSIPFPDRSLVDLGKYERDEEFGLPMPRGRTLFRLLASRGCPHRCSFCGCPTVFGSRIRHRSPANLVAEMETLVHRHRAGTAFFVDDTFAAVPERTEAACRAIRESRLGIEWGCYARADTPEDLLATMHSAGCRFLGLGVESGSPRILDRIHKNVSVADIERTFAACRRLGVRTKAFFMVGLPGETEEDFTASVLLAERIKPDFLWVSIFCPLPGTPFFEETVGDPRSYDFESHSYFHSRDPMIRSRHRRFIRGFYLRPRFAWGLALGKPRLTSLLYAARMAGAYLGSARSARSRARSP